MPSVIWLTSSLWIKIWGSVTLVKWLSFSCVSGSFLGVTFFAFDVTFTGRSDLNYVFDSETKCTGNPATVSGGDTTTVYIKSGDTARIGYNGGSTQIPIGADYSISETGTDAYGYETYIDGSTDDSKSISKTTVATNSENFNTANKTSYVNKKDTAAPTGVMLSILPFVLIALAGIGGAFYVAKNRKVTE
jgi:hypothetical protein